MKAAAPIFPYPGHRTMAAVMADEARERVVPKKNRRRTVDAAQSGVSWIATFEREVA